MSTDREVTRVVRSWLDEGVTVLPDRVLDSVLAQVPATRQRRPWWPTWRFAQMNTYARLAIAAAAVLVVAVVGYNLLPGRQGVGGPGVSPSQTPTATAYPLPMNDTAELAPGTYVTHDPFPVRLAATVPAGWHGWIAGPYYSQLWPSNYAGGGFYFVRPGAVSVDPCHYTKGFSQVVGPTVSDLTEALRNEPGLALTNEASTSISGYTGTKLVVTAAASLAGCELSPEGYVIWQNPLGGISPGLQAGEAIQLWILNVAGTRLVIVIQDSNQSYTASTLAEVQAIFDSIKIDAVAPSAAP